MPQRRPIAQSLVWLGVGAMAWMIDAEGPALGASRSPAGGTAQTVELPISAVTVYRDRARVTRVAAVALSGGAADTRLELPLLPSGVDPASIRVELDGVHGDEVAVQRFELAYLDASEVKLPTQEAEKLLLALETIDDQLAALRVEQTAYAAQLRLLGRVLPSASGLGLAAAPGLSPPPKLNPSGWGAVMTWTRQLHERLQHKSRELEERQRVLSLQRQSVVDKGQQLGGLLRRGGYRVTATLTGSGSAQLALSYQVSGARWQPTYDLQLLPAQSRVALTLAGLVSQETGEDWSDAKLTLSTAVPATATQLPKLMTWKLGERERFIPTPQPQRESLPRPPAVPPLPPAIELDPSAQLQQRFLSRLGTPSRRPPADLAKNDSDKDQADRPVFDELRLDDKKVELSREEVSGGRAQPELMPMEVAEAPPPPPSPPPSPTSPASSPMAQVMVMSESAQRSTGRRSRAPSEQAGPGGSAVVIGFGLAPPPGYRQSASDGYDMVFPALAEETVQSGHGTRRVALLSRSFPVEVSRKIMPALAPEAFLVAELKNPSTEPLPGGVAQLFVGADPAGVAHLKLMAPGEVISLPLGLDRAIRPARNVQVTTVEKGVFSKDEVSEYVVTTEIVNPYRVAIATRIFDQVPLIGDKNVEIKLLRSEPPATFDEKTGTLEWRPQVAAGSKLVTKFVYTLRRPKGYKLGQVQY